MKQTQARAFELGLTRLVSQTATRQDLRDAINDLRREMDIRFAAVGVMFAGVFTLLGVILSKL